MGSFTVELTQISINEMLAIPTSYMGNLPGVGGQTVDVTVWDVVSQVPRTFGYYTRRDGNRRPVFRGGWRSYIQAHELRVGDRVIFERADGVDPPYRIRAQRRINLLGQEHWGDI